MTRTLLSAFFVAILANTVCAQTVLLIPDSTNDRIAAFSPVDGSVINLDFVPDDGTLSTPLNAIDSGRGTLFVSDQIEDAVFEYGLDGTLIGMFAGPAEGLDNVRGIDTNNGNLYVTVGSGALEDTIQEFPLSGGQSTWATTNVDSPFDIVFRDNDALVTNIGTESIESYDFAGNLISNFHTSDGLTGIDFPEQAHEAPNGDILVGGFSAPAGVYRYDSNGNEIAYFDVNNGVRGVYELQNGNILWTAGSGVFSLDPSTGDSTLITDDGSWRFIEAVTIPEPTGLALMLLGSLCLIRRK
ncbi:MAG: hypothetical protein AAF497_13840 [Planctomycetota bacterium]